MQVPEMGQFLALVERVDLIQSENDFLKSLLLGERWLSRKQAMNAIGCSEKTLKRLTDKKVLTSRYEGTKPFYCAFGIRTYLTGRQIEANTVQKRILSALFTS